MFSHRVCAGHEVSPRVGEGKPNLCWWKADVGALSLIVSRHHDIDMGGPRWLTVVSPDDPAGVTFTQAPTTMGPITTAVLDDTVGNLIQLIHRDG